MNARERLEHAADWFSWQDEDLSAKLRTAFDALRLYDYAQAHPELPEMADHWEESDVVAAIGYNPFELDVYTDAETSGADKAADALRNAYVLLDSVAYVKKPGDTLHVLPQIAAALSA
jgi:hypothetical protein